MFIDVRRKETKIAIYWLYTIDTLNPFGDVFVSVFDAGVNSRSGQINIYKMGICYFSSKHAALRNIRKGWMDSGR
jgi:hypothetical protein